MQNYSQNIQSSRISLLLWCTNSDSGELICTRVSISSNAEVGLNYHCSTSDVSKYTNNKSCLRQLRVRVTKSSIGHMKVGLN